MLKQQSDLHSERDPRRIGAADDQRHNLVKHLLRRQLAGLDGCSQERRQKIVAWAAATFIENLFYIVTQLACGILDFPDLVRIQPKLKIFVTS